MKDLGTILQALARTPRGLEFSRGIEREALRVDMNGNLARTGHPQFLGSKLCHPSITTDFSESQLELITPVCTTIEETLDRLTEIHQFVHAGLHEEIMWSASMPCVLHGDNSIPLAQYGSSNLGRLKTTYRNGLGHRYGRSMQTICAVHYNFSFSEGLWTALAGIEGKDAHDRQYRSARYFDLMRNFRKWSWLVVYLYGSSPAVCNSFVRGRSHDLEPFDEGSLYAPGATSLRNGNLGYHSDTQRGLVQVCYNSLQSYVASLATAICAPHQDYLQLGLKRGDEYLQVSANILQSEAEFYSTIRAKRVPGEGKGFLPVLLEDGVEYVEVRLLDVNPYLPVGIDASEMRFLDMLLLLALLADSPEHDDAECLRTGANIQQVVLHGRQAGTILDDHGVEKSIPEWGSEILRQLAPIAAMMDRNHGGTGYRETLTAEQGKLDDPAQTFSAMVLNDMRSASIPFFRFAMDKALAHHAWFQSEPLDAATIARFDALAAQSWIDQKQLESADTLDFDAYLKVRAAAYEDLRQSLL
jgi:glutamate--cysteine ligase